MGIVLELSLLTEILGSNLLRSPAATIEGTIRQISTDTRQINAGDLFVALVGERFDGHNYVAKAVTAGAIAIITSREVATEIPQWIVKDTLRAYQDIGHWWRKQVDIPIIGVTGSVGKTSTKELIAGVLSTQGKVLKTEANFNNEIGVPKTLLNLTPDHDFAVIEMAMRGPGEIARLTEIAVPTIGVITNVGTAHIGRLGSRQAIADAKCELLAFMPDTGVAILNGDDERLMATAKTVWSGNTLSYGFEHGELQGQYVDNQVTVTGATYPVPLPGKHNGLNYLAALAIMQVLNLGWEQLRQGLDLAMPKGRSQQIQLENDIILFDETYNAGVESMLAALDLLKSVPGDRHIAVLGTMKELGEFATELHEKVGAKVAELKLDYVFVLADEPIAKGIATGAKNIPSQCLTDHETLIEQLQGEIKAGDRLLFKASNSVGLNRVVKVLQENFQKS